MIKTITGAYIIKIHEIIFIEDTWGDLSPNNFRLIVDTPVQEKIEIVSKRIKYSSIDELRYKVISDIKTIDQYRKYIKNFGWTYPRFNKLLNPCRFCSGTAYFTSHEYNHHYRRDKFMRMLSIKIRCKQCKLETPDDAGRVFSLRSIPSGIIEKMINTWNNGGIWADSDFKYI